MSWPVLLIAAVFLPLFPFSMILNLLLKRIEPVGLQALLFLLWPLPGIGLLHVTGVDIPAWFASWGVLTALFYAARALALRDMVVWSGFMATSAWALTWVPAAFTDGPSQLLLFVLSFGAPLSLLAGLTGVLVSRFGAAYTGLYGGLTQKLPRLSLALILVVLAIVATPLFPAFVVMLDSTLDVIRPSPVIALAVVSVWLIWSWAGIRMLHGLVVGPAGEISAEDLGSSQTLLFLGTLGLLLVAGVMLLGGL